MEYLGESKAHSTYVRSRKMEYLDSENLKKPYINVEFGQPENKLTKVTTIRFGSDAAAVAEKLQKDNTLGQSIAILQEHDKKGIYIEEGNDQEDVMKKIEKQIELIYPQPQQRRNLRIWCEGHFTYS